MKIVSLKCPYCGATLEEGNGLDTFYCKYCGGKIIMDELSSDAYQARTTEKVLRHKERMQDKAYEEDGKRREFSLREKKLELWGIIVMVVIMIGILSFIFLPDKIEHNQKINELETIEKEIEECIEIGEYDSAIFKANKLYCDDGWSSTEKQAWDSKREAYLELIKELKYQEDIKNPNNILVPMSSKNMEGESYEEVRDFLKASGFTNISCEKTIIKAGVLNKKNTVEHINIGGKTTFDTEDYFDKDAKITIYYYAKQ